MSQNQTKVLLIRALAIALVVFIGAGALYGATSLIAHPDGSSIKLSLTLLKHAPFHDYLVPGIVLFVSNGLCSVWVLVMTLWRLRYYEWFVVSQGAILLGWIIIQLFLIHTPDILHVVMGATGLALVLCVLKIGRHVQGMIKNTIAGDHGQ